MSDAYPAPKNLIGGAWTDPAGGATLEVRAPSDGAVFTRIAAGGAADVDLAVAPGAAPIRRTAAAPCRASVH